MRSYHLGVIRAALVLSFLPVGCSGDAKATSSDAASEDVQAALALAIDGVDTKPESLLEAYRLVEKHPQVDTLPLLVEALETHPRAALHLLAVLPWDHPELAFGPLRRVLVDHGAPFKEDRSGKGLVRIFHNVDRGILRGESAITLACLGDTASYDQFLELVKRDPDPIARQYSAWALGELGRAEAIEPLKAVAKTLPPDHDSMVQGFVQVAIERLEFLRDHSGEDASTVVVARAVSRIASSSEEQVKRIEPALSSLRALDPAVRTKLLDAWSADDSRPTIARASKFALKRLEADK